MHTACFKDAMHNRFFAICNCCSCCCGGLEAMVQHGVPMVASSGYVAQVDELGCIACGDCEEACPFDAVHVKRPCSNEESLATPCCLPWAATRAASHRSRRSLSWYLPHLPRSRRRLNTEPALVTFPVDR